MSSKFCVDCKHHVYIEFTLSFKEWSDIHNVMDRSFIDNVEKCEHIENMINEYLLVKKGGSHFCLAIPMDKLSLVTGNTEINENNAYLCDLLREDKNHCGIEAKYFEPKN